MNKSIDYGSWFFGITGVDKTLYVMADRLEVLPCGTLLVWGGHREEGAYVTDAPTVTYALAAGRWHTFFAADCLDGCAVAEDHLE